jgi:ABC-type proline/glycine betaine transport system permease subunit
MKNVMFTVTVADAEFGGSYFLDEVVQHVCLLVAGLVVEFFVGVQDGLHVRRSAADDRSKPIF